MSAQNGECWKVETVTESGVDSLVYILILVAALGFPVCQISV